MKPNSIVRITMISGAVYLAKISDHPDLPGFDKDGIHGNYKVVKYQKPNQNEKPPNYCYGPGVFFWKEIRSVSLMNPKKVGAF